MTDQNQTAESIWEGNSYLMLERYANQDRVAPHPFKGKTVKDIKPVGSWWNKGWVIYFTDDSWFSTHDR